MAYIYGDVPKIRTDRKFVIDGSVALQEMPSGHILLIDAADVERAKCYSWSRDGRGYAVAFLGRVDGKQKFVKLHRMIIGASDGQIVDHVNGCKLDCRSANLRFATKQGNAANIRKARSSAGFKGVRTSVLTAHLRNPYQAAIVIGGKAVALGAFATAEDAARAYDAAAERIFGEFAATNRKLGLI